MLRQSNAEVLNPKKSRYNGFVKNLTNLIIINVGHVVKKFNFQAYKSHKTPPAIQKCLMASGTSQTNREATQQYLISLILSSVLSKTPKVTKAI